MIIIRYRQVVLGHKSMMRIIYQNFEEEVYQYFSSLPKKFVI